MAEKPMSVYKAIYSSYTGLSPIMAQEICHLANVDGDMPANVLNESSLEKIYVNLCGMMQKIQNGVFHPNIIYNQKNPIEFAALPLTLYSNKEMIAFDTISQVLEHYYEEKNSNGFSIYTEKQQNLQKNVTPYLTRKCRGAKYYRMEKLWEL